MRKTISILSLLFLSAGSAQASPMFFCAIADSVNSYGVNDPSQAVARKGAAALCRSRSRTPRACAGRVLCRGYDGRQPRFSNIQAHASAPNRPAQPQAQPRSRASAPAQEQAGSAESGRRGRTGVRNGNVSRYEDGGYAVESGNVTRYNDGSFSVRNGNVTRNSDGSYAVENGNVTRYSDGSYSVKNGNVTRYSDGRICVENGNSTRCQ